MGRAVATVAGDSSPCSAESSFRELDDVFLQTQTRIWLGEVLQIRLDEQLDISDILADGELLFEVSKVIWKMLLAKCVELKLVKVYKCKAFGSRNSGGRYMPYSNVDSFLKICKVLGLNGIDLFSPSDVVEKRNIRKVCICIRSFSKKARSKHLKVPDFDIVTYTIAMPTDMVGCIRKSLERSQCSPTSYDSHSPNENSRSKFRLKKFVAAGERTYYSYSEGSDDAVSNYMGMQSDSASKNYSNYTVSQKHIDLENSPEMSSVVKNYTSAQNIFLLDTQDLDENVDEQSLVESVGSLCSQYVKNEASSTNNKASHISENSSQDLVDMDLVGDYLDDNTAESCNSHQLAFSDLIVSGIDKDDLDLFNGEEGMFNLYTSTDSHGSSSTKKTYQYGFRRVSGENEDVEVSSVTSMSSVSNQILNFDFDDRFDADDYVTAQINFSELHNYEAESSQKTLLSSENSRDLAKYEIPVHTGKSQFEMKLENFGLSSELFSPCLDDCKSHSGECEDHVDSSNVVESDPDIKEHPNNHLPAACSSNRVDIYEDLSCSCDSVVVEESESSLLQNQGILVQDVNGQCADIHHIAVDNPIVNHNFIDPAKFCETTQEKHPPSTSEISDCASKSCQTCQDYKGDLHSAGYMKKGEIKHDHVGVLVEEISDGVKYTSAEVPKGKPSRKPLLKTVAKGTALVGVLFLLLQLRNRSGKEKTGEEKSKKSSQIQKSNGAEFSSRKEQSRVGGNGIYPAEKLKFGI